MGGQVMGTPIFGTQYVLDFTPEGEEHPNVIDRFVKQEHFCDTHCVWTNHHPDCALAQRKPLTDEALMALLPGAVRLPPGWKDFARAIEAAHGRGEK